eukprot:EG_transcript_15883
MHLCLTQSVVDPADSGAPPSTPPSLAPSSPGSPSKRVRGLRHLVEAWGDQPEELVEFRFPTPREAPPPPTALRSVPLGPHLALDLTRVALQPAEEDGLSSATSSVSGRSPQLPPASQKRPRGPLSCLSVHRSRIPELPDLPTDGAPALLKTFSAPVLSRTPPAGASRPPRRSHDCPAPSPRFSVNPELWGRLVEEAEPAAQT